jgi:uncharacterized phage protein (TIGR02218 family)
MKTITPQLQALFDTGQCNYCGIYQFNMVQGGSLYYASGDVDILIANYTYYTDEAAANIYTDETGLNPYTTETPASYQLYQSERTSGLGLDRKDNKAKMHQAIGLQVDTLTFDVIPGSSLVNGAPFLQCVREGVFDGAELIYSGAFWSSQAWQSPVIPTGTIQKYVGRVAEVDAGRTLATFTINSYLELLNQNMPRNLFSAGCVNTLYDASCTLNPANFAVSSTVAGTSSTAYSIYCASSLAANVFSLGTMTFTSGANSGVSRTIKQATSSNIQLIAPFPSAPNTGDAFTLNYGCDKLQSTCATRFANLQNFRGFPFIPNQEASG